LRTRSLVAIATLGVLAAAAAATAFVTSDHVTGVAATIALAVPTGLAYIASGLVARTRRPHNGTGVLMILVGFAWFFAAFPSANNDLLFTVGLALNGLFIGFLAHLFLAYPSGRLSSRVDRVVTAAMYVLVSTVPLIGLTFDEGDIAESACEGGGPCPENLLGVIAAQPFANVVAVLYGLGVGALSLVVAVRLVRRWRHASPALRSALSPILLTAGALIVAFALQLATSFVSEPVSRAINWVVLVAMLSVPLAFLYGLLRPRLTASTRRLAAELSEQRRPEQVQGVLRRALRDPTLELGYAGDDGYVGVDGQPLRLVGLRSGRSVTPIGDGVILHDASLSDQPELDDVADAVRIAFERGLSMRSLEASERRTRALLDAIPDNVYRVSADGVFVDAHVKRTPENPDAIVYPAGIPAESLIGRKVEDVTPEVDDVIYDGIHRALATDEVVTLEFALENPSGTQYVEERIVRSGDDEVVGIVRDVTERKRQERELRMLADEQAGLARVAVAVATERDARRVFDAATEEVGRLLGAEGANLVRFDPGTAAGVVVGRWGAAGAQDVTPGGRLEFDGPTPVALVHETGKPARVESFDEISGSAAAWIRSLGVRSAVAAPVHVGGRLWGAVVVSSSDSGTFAAGVEERLEKFASLVAVALANAEAHEELTASRARIVRAGDEERRRLERNLHDGAQQRLVTLSLALRMAQARIENDPDGTKALLGSASDELAQALEELRELARGLHPAILSDRGLRPALEALVARAPVRVEMEEVCPDRLPPEVEAAAYYVVAESLTNVARYARAHAARVRVSRRDGVAIVEVEDDGVGGADPARGTGLRGLADRVEALDGRLDVRSERGRGTLVRAELPA
jgi:PAS domain S-box-containing protein